MLPWCNVLARLHIYAVLHWCNVLARLHIYAVLRWCNVLARLRNYVMLPWCNVLARLHKHESCRSPTNQSLLEPPQKFCPSQMKNRTGPTINARFWAISGSIATTCLSEIWRPHARWKERLLKLFVVWCRNWSLKKWQNVRRFGTWMSKTHGCVNPCYHVFTPPHPHPHPLPSPTQPCTHAAWSAAMGTGWRPDRAFGGWYHIQAVPGFCGLEHEQNIYC